jgi:hypothetical protein
MLAEALFYLAVGCAALALSPGALIGLIVGWRHARIWAGMLAGGLGGVGGAIVGGVFSWIVVGLLPKHRVYSEWFGWSSAPDEQLVIFLVGSCIALGSAALGYQMSKSACES